MNRYLFVVFIVSAIAVGISAQDDSSFYLSPALPPTAFEGTYYTVQFRVIGLDFPKYTFKGLPSCFQGSSDGSVSGNPDNAGSYAVQVTISTASIRISRQVVLRIAPNLQATSEAEVLASRGLIIEALQDNYLFTVGQSVQVSLNAKQGVSPYTWNFLNLPDGLVHDGKGRLSGKFNQEGYYTFTASCSDSQGSVAQSYYTLNVQPNSLVKSARVVDVPDRNVPLQYDLNQVEGQQLAANDAVFSAIAVVGQKQNITAQKRSDLAKATLSLNFAQGQVQSAEQNVSAALKIRDAAQANLNAKSDLLDTATHNLQLANTNLDNQNQGVKIAQKNVQQAQTDLANSKNALNDANTAFKNAQDALAKAIATKNLATAAQVDAKNAFNVAFNDLQSEKRELQIMNDKKEEADRVVSGAQNALNIINQANDDASAALQIADGVLAKAAVNLANANNRVATLRVNLDAASTNLGISKFNLQQALNNLYVAQARKAQADKATAIVQSQVSVVASANSTSSYVFSGCVVNAYPVISGQVQVISLLNGGCQVSSGQSLVFGDCTDKDVIKVGDYVSYNGYLKNGYINAVSLKLVTH